VDSSENEFFIIMASSAVISILFFATPVSKSIVV
jgi:hypothetical protein